MAFGLSSLTSLFKSDPSKASAKGSVIGVDIGASAIKIVQIKNAKGVPTLETYGELQLGPYEGVEVGRNTHLPIQKSIEALIDILREASTTGKDIAFALPYSSSFINIVAMPTVDTTQIASMVPIEARKYIPVPLTQVSVDWFALGTDEENKSMQVLILATHTETMGKYATIMSGAGLTTITQEVEVFSSIRSTASQNDEVVAIIDFGAASSRLYIIEKGVIKKTHSILMSGVELTRALSVALSISFDEAEEQKRMFGIQGNSQDPRIQKTIVAVLERGLRELHTVVARYEEANTVKIQKVITTGSGALLKGCSQYVGDMFSVPVVLADPFAKVAYPAFLEDTLKEAGPSFAVAVGVALHAFQTTK